MNTYWISLPCDLLSSLASFQCSLLHHLHLSSDLGLSKYVNQHSHLNLSRNVRLSVLYDLDFNTPDVSDFVPDSPYVGIDLPPDEFNQIHALSSRHSTPHRPGNPSKPPFRPQSQQSAPQKSFKSYDALSICHPKYLNC